MDSSNYLESFFFNFFLKFSFSMLDEIIFHSRHELPHVAHHDLKYKTSYNLPQIDNGISLYK